MPKTVLAKVILRIPYIIASSIQYFAGMAGYNENIDKQVYKDIVWSGLIDMPEFVAAVPIEADRTRIRN